MLTGLCWGILIGIVLASSIAEAMELVRDYRKGVRG